MARPVGIRVHRGSDLVDTQLFERDIIKIGRLASAHLRLDDPKVSRIHAVIDIANGEVSIIDMGSAEGTRVNGEKVSRTRLNDGDEIGLGDSRLVLVLDEAQLATMGGAAAGVAAAGAAATAAHTDVVDVNLDLSVPPPPPPSLDAMATGVFASGATDVQALRDELQASMPPASGSAPNSFSAAPTLQMPVAQVPSPTAPPTSAPLRAPVAVRAPAQPEPPRRPAPAVTALPPLPPIPEDSITSENRYVEVTLRWGNTVTDVRRVRNVPAFTIGNTEGEHTFFMPLEGTTSGPSFVLLKSSQGGGWHVRFTDRMSGTVTRGEHSAPLAQAGGIPDGDGVSLALTDDTTVSIALGYFTIEVKPVPRSRVVPIVPFFDLLWANTAIVTMFATTAMLAVVTLMPLGLASLEDDLLTNPSKFQTLILKPPPKDNSFLNRLKGPKAKEKQAAQKDQGQAGDKKADPKKDKGRMATKAEKPTDEQVVASKLNQLFGDKGNQGIAALFGAEVQGGELEAALGGIDGAKVATGYGQGGLGLRGGGPGGGGTGVATLGTGKIGTRGRGSGEGGYGSSEGGLGAKADHDVGMTMGKETVLGSLDPEIIRRIVREHAGQIRYCYERELTRSPGIYGKIVMKWVINGEGKVTQATTAETQMRNANVEGCLATKIKTWVFPKPKGGGIVIVNYPFVFKQGG